MTTLIKVRGIYTTALTKLLLDGGYMIAVPSSKVQERFGLQPNDASPDVLIEDREDLQGVVLSGDTEKICAVLRLIQQELPDAVLLACRSEGQYDGLTCAGIEFPGASKEKLDIIRSTVAPTVSLHHRFRIIDGKCLEIAEAQIKNSPELKDTIEKDLFLDLILLPLQKKSFVRMEHAKPSGKIVKPREGILFEHDKQCIIVKRQFSTGRYDGLDLPIEEGDYGLTEAQEGSWFIRHIYYSKHGVLKGDYYNINTPVELYPFGIRYMDLEIDVIRRAGDKPFLADREKLSLLVKQGVISSQLEAKAMETAERLMKSLE